MSKEYNEFLERVETEGITLREYARWLTYDDNLPWRLQSGDLVNLLEAAVERLDELGEL